MMLGQEYFPRLMSRITLLPGNSHNITNIVSNFALFPRLSIDIFRLILGVHDRLVMIKPVIARHEIADADSEQEKRHSMIPKQLKRNEHRCDRTISNTAEYRHHSDRRTKRWRNPKKLPEQTAECRTNKKRRHNRGIRHTSPFCVDSSRNRRRTFRQTQHRNLFS